MRRPRQLGTWGLAVGLLLFGGAAPLWAGDMDGDGVDDAIDACHNTPPGIAVDAEGRPQGDMDLDCDTDLNDFAAFALCHRGSGVELPPDCERSDLDGDGDADLNDFSTFALGFTGSLLPQPPPGMVEVAGGEFEMGDPWSEGNENEQPVHTVYISPFYVDICEVTTSEYAEGLNWAWSQGLISVITGRVYQAGSGTTYLYCWTNTVYQSRITWDGSTFGAVSGKEDHPMNFVSWYGSVAFCNWRSAMEGRPLCYDLSTWTCDFDVPGYRLPTEAEWEKAAGWDPVQERHFRFGGHTDGCGYDCLDGHWANYEVSGDPFESGVLPHTTPTGFFNGGLHLKADFDWPGSATSYQTQNAQCYYGCYDMSGNVREWCYDWYDPDYYGTPEASQPDPVGPNTGECRVLRGSNWLGDPYRCRTAHRGRPAVPDHLGSSGGLRCVLRP